MEFNKRLCEFKGVWKALFLVLHVQVLMRKAYDSTTVSIFFSKGRNYFRLHVLKYCFCIVYEPHLFIQNWLRHPYKPPYSPRCKGWINEFGFVKKRNIWFLTIKTVNDTGIDSDVSFRYVYPNFVIDKAEGRWAIFIHSFLGWRALSHNHSFILRLKQLEDQGRNLFFHFQVSRREIWKI